YTRLYWQSVESSLDQVRSSLGVATYAPPIAGPLNGNIGGIGSVPAPGSTTYLRPTPLHESLLPLADQASSQIDIFLAGTNPLVFSVPDVPSVQRDLKNVKNLVFTLRQQAGAGQPASVLKQTLNGMIGDYGDAFNRWN